MKKILISISAFLLPGVALAGTNSIGTSQITNADQVVIKIVSIFNVAIYLLISFAVLYLVWMIVKYFIAGDSSKKGEIATQIGYGILGLFIILSIWGLVKILTNTFSTGGSNTADTANFPKAILP
ncbi:MAG: hypothetical protein NTV72_03890 [Candidatus Taylorbacteria bacterium]|nr:hypothetical protein [Candidatus Taylorbacteria bacterium]